MTVLRASLKASDSRGVLFCLSIFPYVSSDERQGPQGFGRVISVQRGTYYRSHNSRHQTLLPYYNLSFSASVQSPCYFQIIGRSVSVVVSKILIKPRIKYFRTGPCFPTFAAMHAGSACTPDVDTGSRHHVDTIVVGCLCRQAWRLSIAEGLCTCHIAKFELRTKQLSAYTGESRPNGGGK